MEREDLWLFEPTSLDGKDSRASISRQLAKSSLLLSRYLHYSSFLVLGSVALPRVPDY